MYLDGDTTQGLWFVLESQLHITELELKAVHFAVQAFGDRLKNKHCDNSTVAYINVMGGTKSPHCNKIASDVWDCSVNNNTWLTATHIAGVENTEADKAYLCPTQVWWPQLLKMLIAIPFVFTKQEDLLCLVILL